MRVTKEERPEMKCPSPGTSWLMRSCSRSQLRPSLLDQGRPGQILKACASGAMRM